jgi:hypothetical protein
MARICPIGCGAHRCTHALNDRRTSTTVRTNIFGKQKRQR